MSATSASPSNGAVHPLCPTRESGRPIVRVRGLVNRFGEQVVHEGLDLDV